MDMHLIAKRHHPHAPAAVPAPVELPTPAAAPPAAACAFVDMAKRETMCTVALCYINRHAITAAVPAMGCRKDEPAGVQVRTNTWCSWAKRARGKPTIAVRCTHQHASGVDMHGASMHVWRRECLVFMHCMSAEYCCMSGLPPVGHVNLQCRQQPVVQHTMVAV